MVTMASSEFRKRYASLRERTVVTVNGSALGEWIPAGAERADLAAAVDAIDVAVAHLRRELAALPPGGSVALPAAESGAPVRRVAPVEPYSKARQAGEGRGSRR